MRQSARTAERPAAPKQADLQSPWLGDPDPAAATEISDDELTALALAADPDAPLDPEAIPVPVYLAQFPGLLPQWYMPLPAARCGNRWRTAIVLAIIATFLVIEAFGLCSTYGQVV